MDGPPSAMKPGLRSGIVADQIERARGRLFEDEIGRRPTTGFGSSGSRLRVLPEVVYHGTLAVLDRYPTGTGNWFTWDLDIAKAYSRSIPGGSLVYKYGVAQRSDRSLLVLRHRGEFSKTLDRLMAEQGKDRVDGWIELGLGASIMLSRPSTYLKFLAMSGFVPGSEDQSPFWTPWRSNVDQVEAEASTRCRFLRGRRGPGSRGAHDRLLAQEIARRLARPSPQNQ